MHEKEQSIIVPLTQYLSSERRERIRYRGEQEKIKFVFYLYPLSMSTG